MNLSITNMAANWLYGKRSQSTPLQSIDHIADAGFSNIDIAMYSLMNEMPETEWLEWVAQVGGHAAKRGLEINQTHCYYDNAFNPDTGNMEYREKWHLRCIQGTAILGAKWIVMHPLTLYSGAGYSYRKSLGYNFSAFLRYVEEAERLGTGIAVENMVEPISGRWYGTTVEDLLELTERINSPCIGICWDFGHANLIKTDQTFALREIGNHLKATHVHDNDGSGIDQHWLPFMGNIQWVDIMRTLKESSYNGDFSFEINKITGCASGKTQKDMLMYALHLGEYMLSLE